MLATRILVVAWENAALARPCAVGNGEVEEAWWSQRARGRRTGGLRR